MILHHSLAPNFPRTKCFTLQERNTYGVMEVGLWILRIIIGLGGMISTQSLYSRWRDQKTVLKSLQGLNVVSTFTMHKKKEALRKITNRYLDYGVS